MAVKARWSVFIPGMELKAVWEEYWLIEERTIGLMPVAKTINDERADASHRLDIVEPFMVSDLSCLS
jgi:hypothetical protein